MARILAVNWRDPKDPFGGGAEVHLYEILSRMAKRGHEVTWFSCRFPGSAKRERFGGVDFHRYGQWYDANYIIPFKARAYMKRHPVDIVIDDINKIPLFMPLFTKSRVMAVVPHLFGNTVFRETNLLFGCYVYLWERLIPHVYKNSNFTVISESTRQDLIERGVDEERIRVVLCGLDHSVYKRIEGLDRYTAPTVVHFGRLRKYKSIDIVIRAFSHIRRELPDARLLIVGTGPDRPRLEGVARTLGLGDSVRFLGVLSTAELVMILNQAHLFLNASPKEGWGLTVVEANACGMPVVGSDSPGLRDSIRDGSTGYLVEYGDDETMARKALELLRDSDGWGRMSMAAVEWARSLTWERTADEMEKVILRDVELGARQR